MAQAKAPPAVGTKAAPSARPNPGATSTLTPDQQRARAEAYQAQERLNAARRELSVAMSERTAADAEQRHAVAETQSASQALDSLAQARATELARAADQHRRVAELHLQYATHLVDARQAEVAAAQGHLHTTDMAAWISAHPGDTATDRDSGQRRVADARNQDAQAQGRAERLGEVALAAQRQWEDASRSVQMGAVRPPAPGSPGGTARREGAADATGTGHGASTPQSTQPPAAAADSAQAPAPAVPGTQTGGPQ